MTKLNRKTKEPCCSQQAFECGLSFGAMAATAGIVWCIAWTYYDYFTNPKFASNNGADGFQQTSNAVRSATAFFAPVAKAAVYGAAGVIGAKAVLETASSGVKSALETAASYLPRFGR